MGLKVTGQVTAVRREPKTTRSGEPFERITLVVADFGRTDYLDVARDFGPVVDADLVGRHVVIEAAVRAYPRKGQPDNPGWGLSALRRDQEAERGLYGDQTPAVRAAS